MKLRTTIWLACLLAAAPGVMRAAADRVMFGESIYVAPDEEVGDVVCIGCSVRIEGRADDVVVVGGSLDIPGVVAGDAVAVGGAIDIMGMVGGDVVAVAGPVRSSGQIGGDAVSVLGAIDLEPGAEIGGDAVAVFGAVRGESAARVGGSVHASAPFKPLAISGLILAGVLFLGFSLLSHIVVTLLGCLILGEERVRVLRETVTRRAGMSFALGIGVFFAGLVASIVWSVAMFWAPGVEFPFGAIIFALMAVGYCGISLWVGRGIVRQGSFLKAALIGAGLVTLLQWIPLAGWLAGCILATIALGAAVLSGLGTSLEWLLRRSEPEPMARPVAR